MPKLTKFSPNQHWSIAGLPGSIVAAYARRFPEHPSKLRVVKSLAGLLRTEARHPAGGTIRLEPDDYLGWSILVHGAFEPESLARSIDLMRRGGGDFVDVGANVGVYTFAVTSATRCRTVAIEPEPSNFARLVTNLSLNPDLAITLANFAATPTEATVELGTTVPGQRAWTRVGPTPGTNSIRVRGRPLEDILIEAGNQSVALLKIDVEGYEIRALAGLDWNGPRRPQAVLMECAPAETEKHEFMALRGYAVQTIHGASLEGLAEYPEGNVLFISHL